MRIGLLADIEQRAAVILDHLDDRTALCRAGNADLRILPQGDEFAAAHHHRRRARAGAQRCPGIKRLPGPRRALTARVDDDHAAFRFGNGPRPILRQYRDGTEQRQQERQYESQK
jgi:hypothetical protein